MTALHGVMTGAEVDALRLPLRKKLTAIADLPERIAVSLCRCYIVHEPVVFELRVVLQYCSVRDARV